MREREAKERERFIFRAIGVGVCVRVCVCTISKYDCDDHDWGFLPCLSRCKSNRELVHSLCFAVPNDLF